MNSFALCPLQQGYTPTFANNILEQQLLGGFARQRVQFVNNVHTVNASVALHDKSRQQYFWAFWRSHMSQPRHFLWKLIIDDTEMTTYQCQFITDSLQIEERNGQTYKASFSVRCKPNLSDQDFDQSIIDVWESEGEALIFDLLEKLVNIDFPNALESL